MNSKINVSRSQKAKKKKLDDKDLAISSPVFSTNIVNGESEMLNCSSALTSTYFQVKLSYSSSRPRARVWRRPPGRATPRRGREPAVGTVPAASTETRPRTVASVGTVWTRRGETDGLSSVL